MKSTINGKPISVRLFLFSISLISNRLQGAKENALDLQQRLQQYQKKNDEMHDKIGTLERKVSGEISSNQYESFDLASRK